MLKRPFLAIVVLLPVIAIPGTTDSPDALGAAQANPTYAQSNDGFRSQIAAIVQSYRVGDTTTGRQLIEQFRLPHPQDWFSEYLGPEQSTDLAKRYDRLYANFAESLEHTVEAVAANRDAELVSDLEKGKGETPTDLRRPGAKLSGTVSAKPTSLFYCHFKITVQKKRFVGLGGHFCLSRRSVSLFGIWRLAFLGVGGRPEESAPKGGSFSTPPILISRVNPAYPPEARSNRIEGVVVVCLLIDKEGSVKKAEVLSGDPFLTQAALDAVRQWHYKPGTLGGAPSESEVRADINFSLR